VKDLLQGGDPGCGRQGPSWPDPVYRNPEGPGSVVGLPLGEVPGLDPATASPAKKMKPG
jgi:hypothetical protein